MYRTIKLSYIPIKNATQGILSSFRHVYDDILIDDFKFIDNISSGIRKYPDAINDNMILIEKEELIETINSLAQDNVELLVLNGFDISLDEIRNNIFPIVKETGIFICVNILFDVKENNNIAINLDDSSFSYDNEEEWERKKVEILDIMDKKAKNIEEDEEEFFQNDLQSILDLFKPDTSKKYNSSIDDLDVIEMFSHHYKDSDIFITYNNNDSITIEIDNEAIDIPKQHILFLSQSLNSIMDLINKNV